MCISYQATKPIVLTETFDAEVPGDLAWPDEVWQDYNAPIITGDGDKRVASVGSYGMVPKRHIPDGVKKFTTMNARSETVGERRSYSKQWREGKLCLVPMTQFYEPNWETGKHERWKIGMADGSPFAVAGIWRTWNEPDGTTAQSFTQLTINADDHPLMRRFHKQGEEKRSLVIVPSSDWDDWLACRNPEKARSFLRPYPAEAMTAAPVPGKTRSR
jgi:putative SOS response-associated peptidase YedK